MVIIMSLSIVSLIVHVLITAYAVLCMAWLFFYIISL
ncbi:MAG: hypothetical protein [Moriyavirus dochi]|uniref:Uncharacterized protein n=1 Tax=Bacteriophage sp. TaxID=38018 RepID=A0ABY5TS49_9VIRU|nr:MAG: hypothetical protein [Bacteriophage sp.]